MAELRLLDVGPEHLEALIQVRARSFGHLPPGSREGWLTDAREVIEGGRFVGVAAGDRPVAGARIWDFAQWWAGRMVRLGGVAGVVVAPEYRGRGVGSLLMRGVLARCAELGFGLSALYPASVPLYRRLGYEFGGGRYRFSFAAAELRALRAAGVTLRQAGPDDAGQLLELAAQVRSAGRESGLLGWPESQVRAGLTDEQTFCYLAEDGFVTYRWDGTDLRVEELAAGSGQTARALWATVGSGSSIARRVHAYVAPTDPIHLLLGQEAYRAAEVQRWMLRLIDAPAAVAARGWSPSAELDLALRIDDAELPGNTGDWRLRVGGGRGELVPAAPDAGLRVDACGLAALYAGTPVAALRIAGIATGGNPDDDARLDHALGGTTPYMLDYF